MISAYLGGGERGGFGTRNPFDNYSGDGGTDGLAKALAVNVKTADCPDEDTRFSAMLFGKLVGASTIGAEDSGRTAWCFRCSWKSLMKTT